MCGAGDLASIWAELKSIHLRTLNRERCELLAQAWLGSDTVLTPQEVGPPLAAQPADQDRRRSQAQGAPGKQVSELCCRVLVLLAERLESGAQAGSAYR